ncbi:AMP-binding protein [Brevibacterium samyangense]|uniref:Fatty-acid--CoA ligase FadD5 n=1 Tax=Brevibacterium samyangense TaxID=366888 RepID=A0ABP5ESI5_9MICO
MTIPVLPDRQPFLSRRMHWMNMLDLHATDRPDEVVITSEKGEQITWGVFHRRVQALAADLQARGVQPGDRVLILSLNRSEYIAALLAINTVGGIATPLNSRSVPRELSYFIEDSGARILYVDDMGAACAAGIEGGHGVEVIHFDHDVPGIIEAGGTPEFLDIDENSIAMIVYTSGTTSAPKGVMLSYLNLVSQMIPIFRAAPPPSEIPEVNLTVVPLFHIAGLGFLTPAFFGGTRIVLAPPQVLGNIEALADLIEKEQVTSMFLVPTIWQALCSLPGIKERNLPLRNLSWGASPASKETLQLMRDTFPDAQISCAFGQTEMSPVTAQLPDHDSIRKMGSIGKAISAVAVRVINAEGRDVEDGEMGEIVYRGPGFMAGYWNKPEQTEEATHDGWFHSGDLVKRDEEGYMYVVDRAKDLIISGGENISSIEVEQAVAAHPKVADASVVGAPDPKWVETPVAIVVPTDPADPPTLAELQEFLADRIASFKKPTRLEILDELPRNASGKLLKHVLRAEYGK